MLWVHTLWALIRLQKVHAISGLMISHVSCSWRWMPLAACACVPRTMSWAIHARPMHHQYLQQEVFQMREQSSCKVISYLRKTVRQWLTQCSSWWWCIVFVVSLTLTASAKTTLMFAFDRVLPKAVKRLFFSIALITTITFLNHTLTY